METLEDAFSEGVLRKGESLRKNPFAVQRDAEDASVWWVKGSTGSKYRVQVLQENPGEDLLPLVSCTCPNGMNRGGQPRCYHAASVLLVLRDHTEKDHPVMDNPDPVNEDFIDDETAQALKTQGFTDTEIDFLRS